MRIFAIVYQKGRYSVVERWEEEGGKVRYAPTHIGSADTRPEARELIPQGCRAKGRTRHEHRSVVEVWQGG